MAKDDLYMDASEEQHMANLGASAAVSSDPETTSAPSTPVELVPQSQGELDREKTSEQDQMAVAGHQGTEEFHEGTVGHYTVVIGGFCGMFASFGWRAGSGFFQGYYQQHQLRDYSPSTIAWINSVGFFLMYFGACIVGPITQRIGPQPLLLIGSAMHIAGLLGASWCTKFYQLFLTQGIISSLGASAVFFISVQTMGKWFLRQRALALGIGASGVSAGGVIFPLMIERLIPQIGFGWTMRCVVLVLLVLTLASNLTLRSPPEAMAARRRNCLAIPNERRSSKLWDRRLISTIVGTTLFANGYFVVLTFLTTVARMRGWKDNVDSLLVLNGASFFGRIIPGMVADRVGSFNTMLMLGVLSTVLILGLWLPDSGFAGSVIFSVTFGFTSASTVSLGPAMIFGMSELRQITRNLAVLYLVQSFSGLTSSPIGGALLQVGHEKGALYLQLFCGLMTGVGTAMTLLARHWLTRGTLWTKV